MSRFLSSTAPATGQTALATLACAVCRCIAMAFPLVSHYLRILLLCVCIHLNLARCIITPLPAGLDPLAS